MPGDDGLEVAVLDPRQHPVPLGSRASGVRGLVVVYEHLTDGPAALRGQLPAVRLLALDAQPRVLLGHGVDGVTADAAVDGGLGHPARLVLS